MYTRGLFENVRKRSTFYGGLSRAISENSRGLFRRFARFTYYFYYYHSTFVRLLGIFIRKNFFQINWQMKCKGFLSRLKWHAPRGCLICSGCLIWFSLGFCRFSKSSALSIGRSMLLELTVTERTSTGDNPSVVVLNNYYFISCFCILTMSKHFLRIQETSTRSLREDERY